RPSSRRTRESASRRSAVPWLDDLLVDAVVAEEHAPVLDRIEADRRLESLVHAALPTVLDQSIAQLGRAHVRCADDGVGTRGARVDLFTDDGQSRVVAAIIGERRAP